MRSTPTHGITCDYKFSAWSDMDSELMPGMLYFGFEPAVENAKGMNA